MRATLTKEMQLLWTLFLTNIVEANPDEIDYVFVYWLLNLFKEQERLTREKIKVIFNDGHRKNYELELDFTSNNLKDIGVANIMTPIQVDYSKYSSKRLNELIDKQFNKLSQDMSSQILNLLNTGNTTELQNLINTQLSNDRKINSIISNLMRIYRTENTLMRSKLKLDIQQELKKQNIIVRRKWLHTLSNPNNIVSDNYTPREDHLQLNGVIEDNAGYFHTKNGSAPAPGMFNLPEEDINCRCDVVFVA